MTQPTWDTRDALATSAVAPAAQMCNRCGTTVQTYESFLTDDCQGWYAHHTGHDVTDFERLPRTHSKRPRARRGETPFRHLCGPGRPFSHCGHGEEVYRCRACGQTFPGAPSAREHIPTLDSQCPQQLKQPSRFAWLRFWRSR